jgi:hypothetical protein
VFHGQGDERDIAKEDLAKYFRLIDTALHPVLRNQQTPMILAAVQYLLPIFRDASTYPHIASEELAGNPDHLSGHELHARAWPLVAAWSEAHQVAAAAKYHQLAGTGKTATTCIRSFRLPAKVRSRRCSSSAARTAGGLRRPER